MEFLFWHSRSIVGISIIDYTSDGFTMQHTSPVPRDAQMPDRSEPCEIRREIPRLRRPTFSSRKSIRDAEGAQERKRKRKSACFARNDSWFMGCETKGTMATEFVSDFAGRF